MTRTNTTTTGTRTFTVTVPATSLVTPELVERLDNLLEYGAPCQYQHALAEMFMIYVASEARGLPEDLGDFAYRVHYLFEFFESVCSCGVKDREG